MLRNLPKIAVGLCLFSFTFAASADDWLQFREPDGQGHAICPTAPLAWSESDGVVWKSSVPGKGWSSPIVSGDFIWITTSIETPGSEEDLRAALARIDMPVPSPYVASQLTLKALGFRRSTGQLVHDITLLHVDQPVILCSTNSYASPTPVAEVGRLYCDFGAMGTMCLDTDTGKILWSRKLPIEHQVGPGSSPILYGELLILVRDGCDLQYLTALDKQTGNTVWKTNRPPLETSVTPFRKAFSTPLVMEHEGRNQMVIPGAQWMASYDPATGRELWRVDTGPTFSNTSRPVYGQGLVFCGTAYGGSYLTAIRPDGRGDVTETHVAWQTQRSVPKRSSPLLVGAELYMVSDTGVASCLDAQTGTVHWSERLGGRFSASPVYAAGRIYFFDEDGVTTVIQPGKAFRKLAENSLDGGIMATPAFVDDCIFLRTDTHLYRIEG